MKRGGILSILLNTIVVGQEVPLRPAVEGVEVPPQSDESVTTLPGLNRLVSRSGQFLVSGADPLLRGSVAMLAEEVKDELLNLTGERDTWRDADPRVPIAIVLSGSPGDPVPPRTLALSLSYIDRAYELRLDVHLSRGIENARFRRSILSALVYERALRGRVAQESDTPFLVPPWLVEGLLEAVDWRKQRADRRPYETLFKSGEIFALEELFALSEPQHGELGGAMRAAFRVSAGALVMALLEQPEGKGAFADFLADVADYQGEMPSLLRRHFPSMNLSDSSLAKWWTLQMASRATPPLTDAMNIPETEAALGEVLSLQVRDDAGAIVRLPIEHWNELPEMSAKDLAEAVRPAQDALIKLSYRCFPTYRPLIDEYQLALGSIAARKTEGTARQLEGLRQARTIMLAKAERARDFLDWFEITRARETSGAFDDYLLLKERLEERAAKRDDPLSAYLDRIEHAFSSAVKSSSAPRTP
jgi:hypothetical protein